MNLTRIFNMTRLVLPIDLPSGFLKPWRALIAVASLALVFSCTEDSNPELEKEKFVSVFDNNDYSAVFYPIDIRQTSDEGFLILAEKKIPDSNFRGTYLLKADAYGNFVSDLALDDYANPIGDLMEIQNEYYFLTLDMNLGGHLVKVDADLQGADANPIGGTIYPSAASVDGDGFLLLSYDHVEKESRISRHDKSGNINGGPVAVGIGAGDDVEEPIMEHVLRTGKRFPFQVGKISDGLYYFNGFENYSLSLVFTNLTSPLGVVRGYQDRTGFSAVLPLGNGKFAASRFAFGQNYFLPDLALQTNAPGGDSDLGGYVLPELVPDAHVKIIRTTVGTKNVLVFASDTKSKQIGLFFYEEGTGKFITSRYLGFSNPFEFSSIIVTSDEGLAVLGTTWLAGRFPRLCIFKLSKDEVADLVE
jgi:hypothetical protein